MCVVKLISNDDSNAINVSGFVGKLSLNWDEASIRNTPVIGDIFRNARLASGDTLS